MVPDSAAWGRKRRESMRRVLVGLVAVMVLVTASLSLIQRVAAQPPGGGPSLGVRCQHCHVLGHWSEEDKNTKQIARDMMAMTGRINNELLPAIKNIKSEHAGVNCGTCHHGIARPGFGPMQAMQQPPP